MSTITDMVVFDLPMRLKFRGQVRRSGILLHGAAGWAEFSPFPDYDDATSARWLDAARDIAELGFPPALRDRIPVNTTVPAVDAATAYELVRASGCTTAKGKVAEAGQTLSGDIARVEAVRDALGPDGKLRVDANAAWTVDEAVPALKALDVFALEYAEQPVRTLEEMAQLRRRVDVLLAADESVRRAEDPMRVAGLEAADIVVLKVQPIGGVRRCVEVAEACGLPVVVSSAVETSVGIAAGAALAAALPELPYACGLGTMALLEGDVVADPLTVTDGAIDVRRPEVDEDALRRYEIDGAAWRRRAA